METISIKDFKLGSDSVYMYESELRNHNFTSTLNENTTEINDLKKLYEVENDVILVVMNDEEKFTIKTKDGREFLVESPKMLLKTLVYKSKVIPKGEPFEIIE
jgi:hypothetical protein